MIAHFSIFRRLAYTVLRTGCLILKLTSLSSGELVGQGPIKVSLEVLRQPRNARLGYAYFIATYVRTTECTPRNTRLVTII